MPEKSLEGAQKSMFEAVPCPGFHPEALWTEPTWLTRPSNIRRNTGREAEALVQNAYGAVLEVNVTSARMSAEDGR